MSRCFDTFGGWDLTGCSFPYPAPQGASRFPLPKEVGDRKLSIPLPSQKLCFCLWEGGTPIKYQINMVPTPTVACTRP